MGDEQVRRLAVLGADHRIVGIVALGDLATR
jgi:CBS domain-containing protein